MTTSRIPRRGPLPRTDWYGDFLDALRAGASVRAAAQGAGTTHATAYTAMLRDVAFAQTVAQARLEGAPGRRERRRQWGAAHAERLHRTDWQAPFLNAIREGFSVKDAARLGQVSTSIVYRQIRADPALQRAYWAARADAARVDDAGWEAARMREHGG